MKVRHTLKSCSSSNDIRVDGGRKYFFPIGERIEMKYLHFIKDVKREVCENAKGLNLSESKPYFVRFSPVFYESFYHTDFVEVDISSAYWFTAFDFGLVSEKTYNEGLNVPKKVRLMALGSAAATKEVMYFDGERYEYKGIEYDNFGRLAFFSVAKRVDEIMNAALENLHGNVAFYWVDALFIRKSFADFATDTIRGFGYQVKETRLLYLKGDSEKKCITAMRILDEKILKNGHEIMCLEKKVYYRPQKLKKNKKKNG